MERLCFGYLRDVKGGRTVGQENWRKVIDIIRHTDTKANVPSSIKRDRRERPLAKQDLGASDMSSRPADARPARKI